MFLYSHKNYVKIR